MRTPGTFVVSFDLELFWGMHDITSLDAYGANIRGERDAIPGMLELFKRYDIHATWAVVGMLAFGTREKLLAALPSVRPSYANEQFSTYRHIASGRVGEDEAHDPHHFGASFLAHIRNTPGQEIACHTFSHFYCLEEGADLASFRADLLAWRTAVDPRGEAVSIVFPRNQVRDEHLAICLELGFRAYRGTQTHTLYKAVSTKLQYRPHHRAFRLVDSYVPLTGHHTYPRPVSTGGALVNVPASAFLRPYTHKLSFLETAKIHRVTRSMSHAATSGEVYHLWWHPHNFGVYTKENLRSLERILNHFDGLRKRGLMENKSMGELVSPHNV